MPADTIKLVDKLRDDLVNAPFDEARQLRCQIAAFKLRAMQQIRHVVDLSTAECSVNYGATKGNVTLTSLDRERCVRRAADECHILMSVFRLQKKK
ncbi:MAG: DUF3164 family protein [Sodalis sp. (in: enterobacteria)]